jgi:AmmeMemoRadiSam system protein B
VDDPEVGAFCAALRKVLDVHGDSVGIIGGVDLSHCGPQFGDEELNGEEREKEIETGDRAALAAVETGDPDRFLDAFREDGNSRHVCSISTIYCVLEAMRGRATPRLLSYAQANSEDHACLVSFASVAFLRNGSQSPGARILIVPG